MPRGLVLLFVLALFGGCALVRSHEVLEMDAVVVTVDPEELELSKLNDAELFACGAAAHQGGDYRRAARCFTRLADLFPESPRARAAQYAAGRAYEAMGEHALAYGRYREVMDPAKGVDEALDAAWRAATSLYHLDDFAGAIMILEPISTRDDLSTDDRIHALAHLGVCNVELGELTRAEALLRRAVKLYEDESELERLEPYFPGQAQFFLGEVYRLYFETVKLSHIDDLEKLKADLEYKAQLLLSAQGHFLRAIRIGHPHWATAAGRRIGGLYEQLFEEMTQAPVPSTLDATQAEVYRALLRKRIRVLVQKAIAIYERTLAAAERIGVASAFVEQTKASLERMKQVLLADAAREAEAEAASAPKPASPAPERAPSTDTLTPAGTTL